MGLGCISAPLRFMHRNAARASTHLEKNHSIHDLRGLLALHTVIMTSLLNEEAASHPKVSKDVL